MPRPKKTAAQLQATREKILDTAYAILQTEGPEAISSRAIAERLGVAHMALFTYFENQAAILRALTEREVAKMRVQQVVIAQRAETEKLPRVVEDLLRFYITFARENPNAYRLAWVMPEKTGETVEQNRERMRSTVGQLASLLNLGQERGAFERRDPFLAASTVLGMVNMPHILFHTGKMVDPTLRDRIVEEVLYAAMLYLQKK
jgi:AcrR family transcriptional regulator